jgi:hypothetical protein
MINSKVFNGLPGDSILKANFKNLKSWFNPDPSNAQSNCTNSWALFTTSVRDVETKIKSTHTFEWLQKCLVVVRPSNRQRLKTKPSTKLKSSLPKMPYLKSLTSTKSLTYKLMRQNIN